MNLDLGTLLFGIALISQTFLLAAQIKVWKSQVSSFVLLVSTFVTFTWCLLLLLHWSNSSNWFTFIPFIEVLKNIAWFMLLLSILGLRRAAFSRSSSFTKERLFPLTVFTIGIPFVLFWYISFSLMVRGYGFEFPDYGGKGTLLGFLLVSIVGLALLEQVLRNTRSHHQWHLKYLVLGLGILFTYDLYFYSDALLFGQIDDRLWQIRGMIIVLATPFLVIAVLRTRQQPIQLNISRRLVFHTSVLFAASIYLLLMASAAYYIRTFSGQWGLLLQVLFWVSSLSLLLVLTLSGRMRSLLKMYINRNLFSTKYDYRDEWMKISQALTQPDSEESLPFRAVNALANIVDSPSGGLWLSSDGENFDQVAQLEMGWVENSSLKNNDYLVQYLSNSTRVVNLNESELEIEELPVWLNQITKLWLIIPLSLHGNLIGFVLLKEPRVEFDLIWEDYDLLMAVGQQTASYLAQMLASDALSEARQFSAFNQVSAFVVHDIKTLNSQLSMMVKNAEKHKNNPVFIDDMIETTEHAVQKMNHLLGNFRKTGESKLDKIAEIDLVDLVKQVVQAQSKINPVPVFKSELLSATIRVNEEDLKSAIGHLIQNAQEAALDNGEVKVELIKDSDTLRLIISDTGRGMTQEFVQTRLFKPFESTKGLAGMGVGVFQSREYIRVIGGELTVKSKPGVGTTFTISLQPNDQSEMQVD